MEDPIVTELKQSKSFRKGGGKGEARKVPHYYNHIINSVSIDGLWLDFCIGKTTAVTQHIHANSPEDITIHGFDWFKGLPEEWRCGKDEIYRKGEFGVSADDAAIESFVAKKERQYKKLKIVTGLIQDTLPNFLVEYDEPCAFMHFDCDLYSSTDFTLRALQDRIVPGTVIAFDEFYGYDNYFEGEYKAWMEFVVRTEISWGFIAHVAEKRQAAIKIL